jgi:hypothetical protein
MVAVRARAAKGWHFSRMQIFGSECRNMRVHFHFGFVVGQFGNRFFAPRFGGHIGIKIVYRSCANLAQHGVTVIVGQGKKAELHDESKSVVYNGFAACKIRPEIFFGRVIS